jgi:hypothetical protein
VLKGSRRSASPQLSEPLPYLLVIMQVAAALARGKIDPMEAVQRPPGGAVPSGAVLQHPPCRPAIGVVPGQPTRDKLNEAIFDLIKSRPAAVIHALTVQAGQTLLQPAEGSRQPRAPAAAQRTTWGSTALRAIVRYYIAGPPSLVVTAVKNIHG